MADNASTVSVIIPVFDDYRRLLWCLDALSRQSYPPEQVEILVVDNGTPPERRMDIEARYDRVKLLVETAPGSYAARNAGLRAASGQMIAFTDADCLPAADWIENGVATLRANPGCGLVGGSITLFAEDPGAMTLAETWEILAGFPQQKYVEQLNFAATANVFTHRSVFEKVGEFNAALQSGGDREWGERVAAAGYPLVYADHVCIRHPARQTLSALLRKTRRTTRGDFRRQHLQGQWTPKRRTLRLGEALFKLATPLPRAGVQALKVPGSLSVRSRFALTQTLVTCAKEWEMARLLSTQHN